MKSRYCRRCGHLVRIDALSTRRRVAWCRSRLCDWSLAWTARNGRDFDPPPGETLTIDDTPELVRAKRRSEEMVRREVERLTDGWLAGAAPRPTPPASWL